MIDILRESDSCSCARFSSLSMYSSAFNRPLPPYWMMFWQWCCHSSLTAQWSEYWPRARRAICMKTFSQNSLVNSLRCVIFFQVATANTMSRLFSVLPSCGRPTRVLIYDIHTSVPYYTLHERLTRQVSPRKNLPILMVVVVFSGYRTAFTCPDMHLLLLVRSCTFVLSCCLLQVHWWHSLNQHVDAVYVCGGAGTSIPLFCSEIGQPFEEVLK